MSPRPLSFAPRRGRLWLRRPHAGAQRIGLFGGSFDPAHRGHLHVAEIALRRCGLDAIWFVVAAQNPLKPQSSPYAARLAGVEALIARAGRRFRAVDIERASGLAYTADVLGALKAYYPATEFVFVMGADSFAGLHRWRRWRAVLAAAPVLVVSRPKPGRARPILRAATGRAAAFAASGRIAFAAAGTLARARPPAWVYAPAPLFPVSSSQLRAAR